MLPLPLATFLITGFVLSAWWSEIQRDHWYTFSFCYCMICFMLLFALLFSMNALASRLKYNLFEQSILFLVPFMIPSCRKLHPFCMLIRFGIQIYEIVIVVYEIHELCLPMVLQCTDLKVRLEKSLFTLNDSDHIFKLVLDYCHVLLDFL